MDEHRQKLDAMFEQLRLLLSKVDDPGDRVMAAWSILDDTWETFVFKAERGGTPINCRRGCAYCCHVNVEVGWVEAAVIAAEVIAEHPELEPGLRAEAKARAGKQPPEIFGRACPFLADSECSIHLHRPMICRGYNSMDVKACAGGVDSQVPMVEELILVAKAGAGVLMRLDTDRPAKAPLGGELCAMVVAEIDRQRA